MSTCDLLLSLLSSSPSLPPFDPSSPSSNETQKSFQFEPEIAALDRFIIEHSGTYEFSQQSSFHQLFDRLVQARLLDKLWLDSAPKDHVLRILQSLRILTRDPVLQQKLISLQAIPVVAVFLTETTTSLFLDEEQPFLCDILVELTSIVNRLSPNDNFRVPLVQHNVHHSLALLLRTSHTTILRCVLEALVNLAESAASLKALADLDCWDCLIDIMESYDTQYKQLAAELVALLTTDSTARQKLRAMKCSNALVSLMYQSQDVSLLLSVVAAVEHSAIDMEAASEFRLLGLVNALLTYLTPVATVDIEAGTLLQAVISCLTQLSMDDETAFQIRQSNGICLLGKLLISPPALIIVPESSEVEMTPESIALKQSQWKTNLQIQTLKCLRFLFSVERNRKVFKRLFPPELFGAFIDVGNYCKDLAAYVSVQAILAQMPPTAIAQIQLNLEEIQSAKTVAQRTVREYRVMELLGKGAFGSVYMVQKEQGDARYAMKEIPLTNLGNGVNGSVDGSPDQLKAAEELSKEVAILKELQHPNIVRYFKSFVEGSSLFIIMELMDGSSLSDFLQSISDKGQNLPEESIWKIFIQLVLALKYLHVEKHVVHRDLTPANIMVDANMHVKIADFGLARKRSHNPSSVMQSVVGTILYSCPEIVQHQPYTEKADIWSLGCVLYQITKLKPPFAGSNPLSVARKIVEGEYDPVDPNGVYSPLLNQVISRCMSNRPESRPDILQVTQAVAPLLLNELDKAMETERQLREELNSKEKRLKQTLETHRVHQLHQKLSVNTQDLPSSPIHVVKGAALREMITMSPHKVRPISDPISALLSQLHKIVFIAQLPPSIERNPKRAVIEKYKRALFANRSPAVTLKSEMNKLLTGSRDLVDFDVGVSPNSPHRLAAGRTPRNADSVRITYEDLHQMIEEVLAETDQSEPVTLQLRNNNRKSDELK